MTLKFNWGFKITLLYSAFVVLILSLVFMCFGQDVDLVSKNYYQDEIKYQERIEARANYNLLSEKISTQTSEKNVTITFPSAMINEKANGEVYLYRPSDSHSDVKVPLQISADGKQTISDEKIIRGAYKLQVSWKMSGKDYYYESDLNF